MYFGCNETMVNVIDKYFERENTGMFAVIWKKARNCAQRNLDYKDKDKDLTMDHMLAICVYTSSFEKLYEQFNNAVRTNRSSYVTSFPFHSLHFWLTSAVQILSRNTKCLTTYRRSNFIFTGHVNDIIRFGFFASCSRKPSLLHFGEKTCFKIKTCSGAYLKKYPHLKDYEEEVLIPPYEIFKITEKIQNIPTNENNCETEYVLESAGVHSNLNCLLVHWINDQWSSRSQMNIELSLVQQKKNMRMILLKPMFISIHSVLL